MKKNWRPWGDQRDYHPRENQRDYYEQQEGMYHKRNIKNFPPHTFPPPPQPLLKMNIPKPPGHDVQIQQKKQITGEMNKESEAVVQQEPSPFHKDKMVGDHPNRRETDRTRKKETPNLPIPRVSNLTTSDAKPEITNPSKKRKGREEEEKEEERKETNKKNLKSDPRWEKESSTSQGRNLHQRN